MRSVTTQLSLRSAGSKGLGDPIDVVAPLSDRRLAQARRIAQIANRAGRHGGWPRSRPASSRLRQATHVLHMQSGGPAPCMLSRARRSPRPAARCPRGLHSLAAGPRPWTPSPRGSDAMGLGSSPVDEVSQPTRRRRRRSSSLSAARSAAAARHPHAGALSLFARRAHTHGAFTTSMASPFWKKKQAWFWVKEFPDVVITAGRRCVFDTMGTSERPGFRFRVGLCRHGWSVPDLWTLHVRSIQSFSGTGSQQ